jgi:tetratricopeptide (TPR) repeat protein
MLISTILRRLWVPLLALAFVASLPRLAAAREVNAWSLAYVSGAMGASSSGPEIGAPPGAHSRARFWLAQAALEAGDPDRALALLDSDRSTTDPGELDLLARVLEANGDFAGAVAAWMRRGNVQGLWAAASRAVSDRRLEDALSAYQAAYAIDAEGGALPLANFLHWSMRDVVGAEEVLNQAVALFPAAGRRATWFVRLGDVLRAQERWAEASASYQQALSVDDDMASAHIGLGWVYYESMGDAQAAEAEFSRAIELASGRGEGYAAMGELTSRVQRYAEAEQWFLLAMERSSGNRWWRLARADAVRSAGEVERALLLYEEIVSQFPDFGESYFEMARMQAASGDHASAVWSMDQALALIASPIAWHYAQAGWVFGAANDWGRAVYAYRRALVLEANYPAARAGLERAEAMLAAPPAP